MPRLCSPICGVDQAMWPDLSKRFALPTLDTSLSDDSADFRHPSILETRGDGVTRGFAEKRQITVPGDRRHTFLFGFAG